ncbi:MAG: 2-amino-4-hydroxy-6-hydroxymethyldihydropteridine diphosphokinase [Nitrospirae bacterium]|nr:2-amino-4-hydroxy-6-hydroxymethyldihydropteridine diphosphokinase [Nitrospirota bacterium]
MKENKVFIGIGTNVGDRRQNIENALFEIGKIASIKKKSSIHETKPVGYKDQGDFFNMAIGIETDLKPIDLIIKLQEIEHKMGRVRDIKNGPRIIDLDILTYGNEIINEPDLIIPHPRMFERDFVMKPLKEITDDFNNR